MRKIFQLGGIMGVCFSPDKIDLSIFKGKVLNVRLPDGKSAAFVSMEIVFQTPNFSDPSDFGAHRASSVTLSFLNVTGGIVDFELSGAYFWRFLEAVPDPFRILSNNNQTESYINEALEQLMPVARHLYHGCFVDTTPQNICPPPESCKINLVDLTFSVTDRLTLPDKERVIIRKMVNENIDNLDLAMFSADFADGMLADGYLSRDFVSEGEYLRPVFTPEKWCAEKHKQAHDYLQGLSKHSEPGCPAYITWYDVLKLKTDALVKGLFAELFTLDALQSRDDLSGAKAILENNIDLFDVEGANDAADKVSERAIIAIEQYIGSLADRH